MTRLLLPFALLLAPGPLPAQEGEGDGALLPIRVTATAGIANPEGDYSSGCGYSYLNWEVEARTRGRWFAALSAVGFSAGVGADIECLRGSSDENTWTYSTGGLELENASRAAVWAGRRAGLGPLGLEAKLGTGLLRGTPGYVPPDGDPDARWLPWVGGALAASTLWDHLVISYERGWTRLPFRDEIYHFSENVWLSAPPPRPEGPPAQLREYHNWSRLTGLRIGVRF